MDLPIFLNYLMRIPSNRSTFQPFVALGCIRTALSDSAQRAIGNGGKNRKKFSVLNFFIRSIENLDKYSERLKVFFNNRFFAFVAPIPFDLIGLPYDAFDRIIVAGQATTSTVVSRFFLSIR